AMITAVLNGELKTAKYKQHTLFGLSIPLECPGVPTEILDPSNTWKDKNKYKETATKLAQAFAKNFEQYKDVATAEIIAGGPKINESQKELL
ncbi:MAG: phosphoenolpyruvate carboxykinase (ATP), partial [Bacteroidia bacterium]